MSFARINQLNKARPNHFHLAKLTIARVAWQFKVNSRHPVLLAHLLLVVPNAFSAQAQTPAQLMPFVRFCDRAAGAPTLDTISPPTRNLRLDFEHSMAALCRRVNDRSSIDDQLADAAEAAELLIDAGRTTDAGLLFAVQPMNQYLEIQNWTLSALRFEMARARVLSSQNKNAEALDLRAKLQEALDIKFGVYAHQSVENRLRMANIEIELGQESTGLNTLESLEKISTEQISQQDDLRRLILKSHALAIALSGDDAIALPMLRRLRSQQLTLWGADDWRVIDADEDIASVLMRGEELDEAMQ